MKRIVIGDPHGRWRSVKKIYDYEQPDEVIILGDYFDSFNIDAYEQRESYNNIIELRKNHLSQHKGKFDLLIGNHDFSIISFISYKKHKKTLAVSIIQRIFAKVIRIKLWRK